MKKALILLSGGLDSTYCLIKTKQDYDNILAISFNYGQKNIDELQKAKKICNDFNIEHRIIDLSFYPTLAKSDLFNNNELTRQSKAFVPGRNQMFLTIASIIAYEENITDIIFGTTLELNHKDNSPEFVKAMSLVSSIALGKEINIITPLGNKSKQQIFQELEELNMLDYINKNTLTCFNNIEGKGCGICNACFLRNIGLRRED